MIMKSTTYIISTLFLFFTILSCVDADPLQPDGPNLETSVVDVVFDASFTFQRQTEEIEIKNTGDTSLVIDEISISDNTGEEFNYSISSLVIPEDGVGILEVSFKPSDFIRYSRDLVIKSNFENDVLVRLEGTGIPNVLNQDEISFTAQSSIDQFAQEMYDIVNTKDVTISSTANINDPILDLSALSVIKEVEVLRLISNSQLENLEGLDDLLVKNELIVRSNGVLGSLDQMNGLVSSNISIHLENNRGLSSLDFLNGLTMIGDLRVINNRSLVDFTGAESIETIDGDLVVLENSALKSLKGLEGISVSIEDELSGENRFFDDVKIQENEQLDDYCSLLNILSGSEDFFGNIIIINNKLDLSLTDFTSGTCN